MARKKAVKERKYCVYAIGRPKATFELHAKNKKEAIDEAVEYGLHSLLVKKIYAKRGKCKR